MRNIALRSLTRRPLHPSPPFAGGGGGPNCLAVSIAAETFLRRSSPSAGAAISRFNYLLDSRGSGFARSEFLRQFSSINEREELELEEEAERKAGWLLKIIFVATGSLVAFQFFPYMGDNLLQQSISLLHVKDPLFKRMGASRLARYAVDDERRMKVVDLGGAEDLLTMLKNAKDEKTRKEALKALVALSHCDEAAKALHQADAVAVVNAVPKSSEYAEIDTYKSSLLKKFQELKSGSGFPAEVEVSLSS